MFARVDAVTAVCPQMSLRGKINQSSAWCVGMESDCVRIYFFSIPVQVQAVSPSCKSNAIVTVMFLKNKWSLITFDWQVIAVMAEVFTTLSVKMTDLLLDGQNNVQMNNKTLTTWNAVMVFIN